MKNGFGLKVLVGLLGLGVLTRRDAKVFAKFRKGFERERFVGFKSFVLRNSDFADYAGFCGLFFVYAVHVLK